MPKINIARLLAGLDITEIFKTKGDLKRWSAKRTIGGTIVLTACAEIANDAITWPAVVLCLIGIVPICLSFFAEK